MKIADICGTDTGGQSFKLSRAIREYTPHLSRSLRKDNNYLDFPADIEFGKHDKKFISDYLSNVDIVHCHNMYRYANGWSKINPRAKWIIHQHGRFGTRYKFVDHIAADLNRDAKRFVSTINLLKYVNDDPDRWIPAPFRLSEFDDLKEKFYKPHENIRIAHSPTRRDYKNTDLLIEIVSKFPQIELVLIEGRTNKECLEIKASCDITFDQTQLCYGNSGLEGMAFSQPTIVGMDQETRSKINEIIGYEPFVFATPETLKEVIIKLVASKRLRDHWGTIGRKYIEDWHDDRKVAEKMIKIYESL